MLRQLFNKKDIFFSFSNFFHISNFPYSDNIQMYEKDKNNLGIGNNTSNLFSRRLLYSLQIFIGKKN